MLACDGEGEATTSSLAQPRGLRLIASTTPPLGGIPHGHGGHHHALFSLLSVLPQPHATLEGDKDGHDA